MIGLLWAAFLCELYLVHPFDITRHSDNKSTRTMNTPRPMECLSLHGTGKEVAGVLLIVVFVMAVPMGVVPMVRVMAFMVSIM